MNHDDAFSNSMFDLPVKATKSTSIEPVTDIDLAIEQAKSPVGTLAATQDYQSRQVSVEKSQSLASSVVDNFLPSPNRFIMLGGLGLVAALGIGGVAANFMTYRTTVKAQAVVQPVGDVQVIQSGMGGVVETILVQEYDTLKPDQVIISFENSPLQNKLLQIEARIAGTEERIFQVDGQLKTLERRRLAESTWLQQLTTSGLGIGGGAAQFEYSKARLLEYRNDLATQLQGERDQLKQAQQQIDNLIIRSPAAGSIYDLQLDKLGQTVNANETIAKLVPDGVDLEIKALIPDTQIKNVEVGYPTQMKLSQCASFSFGALEGQVTSVEPLQPDADTDLVKSKDIPQNSYIVTINAPEKSLQSGSRICEVLPGMKGELKIMANQEKLMNFFLRKLRFKTNV